jgi:deoxyadenosine/deoxycytidine kinase
VNYFLSVSSKIREDPNATYIMEKSLAEMIYIFLPQLKNCPAELVGLCEYVERNMFTPHNIKYILVKSTVESCYSQMSDAKKVEITVQYISDLQERYAKIADDESPIKISHSVEVGTSPISASASILEFITGTKIGYVPQVFVVAGNIAVGKTSTLTGLKAQNHYIKKYEMEIFLEDTDAWEPYLKKFYAQPKKNWFDLQFRIITHYMDLETKIEALCRRNRSVPLYILVERSPIDILKVFIEPMKDKVDEREFSIISQLCERLCSRNVWRNAKTILLRGSTKTCFERCKKRNRNSEKTIKPNYLKSVNDRHENINRNIEIETDIVTIAEDGTEQVTNISVPEIVDKVREWIESN